MHEEQVVELVFANGPRARAVGLEGGLLLAVGPVAFAPGRPLQMRVQVGEVHFELRAKSLGSKRRDEGSFDLRLRPIDLRREHRELLVGALAS